MFDVSSIKTWQEYDEAAKIVEAQFADCFKLGVFDYEHPVRLQKRTPKYLRKPYLVPVKYTEWGDPARPTIICLGGVANTAMRFNSLAHALSADFHVICMDWVGRGVSGWMYAPSDYSLGTYTEQLRQLVLHLKKRKVSIVGSSLGGSVAIAYASGNPGRVTSLALNDVGPFIPVKRRKRRSQVLGRYYVFRTPGELLRRLGASQKNDGPLSDFNRFCNTYYLTRWSIEEEARVYRYDLRAMLSYAEDAQVSLEQWDEWHNIHCPVLAIHGQLSDVLTESTLRRMQRDRKVAVMDVPNTGHTPALTDANQIAYLKAWFGGEIARDLHWCVLHADHS